MEWRLHHRPPPHLDAMRGVIFYHSVEMMDLLIKNGLTVKAYENHQPPLINDILTSGAPKDKMNGMLQLFFGEYKPPHGEDTLLISILKLLLLKKLTYIWKNGGILAKNELLIKSENLKNHLDLNKNKYHETLQSIPQKHIKALIKPFANWSRESKNAESDEIKTTLVKNNTHPLQGPDNNTKENPSALLSNSLFGIVNPIFNDIDSIIYKPKYYPCNKNTEDDYLKNPPDNTECNREDVALTGVNTDSEFC